MTERTCRLCGCTPNHACQDEDRGACHWVADDLCSHCQDSLSLVAEIFAGIGRSEPIKPDTEYDEIRLPMHHAEQLVKIGRHLGALPVEIAEHFDAEMTLG